jgi:vacuolar-type H+-ATPase catalytic subunit A/Vma1
MENEHTPTQVHRATISFHLTNVEKKELQEKAFKRFDTLSDYVRQKLIFEKDAYVYEDQIQKLQEEIELMTEKHMTDNMSQNELRDKLSFYENGRLKELFDLCNGQHVKFKSPQGKRYDLVIESIEDLFDVIVNCYKI